MVFHHAKIGLFSPSSSRTAVEQHLDALFAEACAEHSLDVVQFLLSKGAQPPNGARTDHDSADLAKERGHAWVDMIDVASQSKTKDAAAKADLLVRKSGYNGVVPGDWIDYAIRHEKIAALQVMLPQYRPNFHQCEHLHVAVDTVKPNLEIVQLLLNAGEDVNKVPKKDSRPYAGEAPIHVATRRGSHEAVKLLRQHGAKVDIRGKNFRRTALHLAVHRANGPTNMKLLEALRGAKGTVKDNHGKTALDYALERGDKKVITWLMREAGATD